jgi:glycosyltransferase involved in cell wall biosynthesis
MQISHFAFSVSKQSASYRIHNALLKAGINSKVVVASKSIERKEIHQPNTWLDKILALLPVVNEFLLKKVFMVSSHVYFSVNKYQSVLHRLWFRKSNNANRDITHLHWVGNGFVSLRNLREIKGPIVVTLHDMWFMTGGCHVNLECNNYLNSCKTCPRVRNKIIGHNLTSWSFQDKKKFFGNGRVEVVVLSSWMQELALQSPILKGVKVHLIPNGIDQNRFKPISRKEARRLFNFGIEDSLILFGGISALSDYNKGFDLLKSAIENFRGNRKNLKLITFGSPEFELKHIDGVPTINVGILKDEESITALYSAVNVVAVPSRQESFSQICAESISCGTPVVAFDHSGPKDIISHKQTGYLAPPYDVLEFAQGIEWLLGQDLREACKQSALVKFDLDEIAKKHIDVYENILMMNS